MIEEELNIIKLGRAIDFFEELLNRDLSFEERIQVMDLIIELMGNSDE